MYKRQELKDYVIYDRYRRGGMIEHFLSDQVCLEDFRRLQYEEPEPFFRPAEMKLQEQQGGSMSRKASVIFRRLFAPDGIDIPVTKEIAFESGTDGFDLEYSLENHGAQEYWGCLLYTSCSAAFSRAISGRYGSL